MGNNVGPTIVKVLNGNNNVDPVDLQEELSNLMVRIRKAPENWKDNGTPIQKEASPIFLRAMDEFTNGIQEF